MDKVNISLNFIALLTACLTLVSAILPIIFYFHKRKNKLILSSQIKSDNLKLLICNPKEIDISITHIRLVDKQLFSSPRYDKKSFFTLFDYKDADFGSTQNDTLDITIKSKAPNKEFLFPLDNISNLYDYFIPYEYLYNNERNHSKILNKPTKMTNCCLGVFLKGGKIITLSLPKEFYSFYKELVASEYDSDIRILNNKSNIKLCFKSLDSYINYKNCLLDYYQASKKNSLLLFK